MTRKLVAYVLTTIDGAVDDPNRMFPAAVPSDEPAPPAFDAQLVAMEAELIARQDTVLLGRNTYEQWSRFWPTSDDQPFADFINGVPKLVAASRPIDLAWGPAQTLAAPIFPTVEAMKNTPGGDIGLHGSITLTQHLLHEGLVDELHLVVAPVIDPEGRRLFEHASGLQRMTFQSAAATSSGAIWLTYRR